MSNSITIIMYHYVRDLKHSRYPEIKGLDLSLFKGQIEYIERFYNIIKMEDLIESIEQKEELPSKAALLTFDDGYIEHYLNVFPVLQKKKLQGSFYPPVKVIKENIVLNVNKIHFILASVENKHHLIERIYSQLDYYRSAFKLKSNEYYFNKLAKANRFDSKEIIFFKHLLQVELQEELRNIITNNLFREFVSSDEQTFSKELYMSTDQLECMLRNGMHIGSHGYDHYWLSSLNKEKQREEIINSVNFIKTIGGNLIYWTISYPYGDYNNDTIEILKETGCKVGLTTHVDIANVKKYSKLELPRLDTTDIPTNENSNPNHWFTKHK